ncbi:positive regulation of myeloid dendritic cell activation [Mactra antiquata]
MNGLAMVMFLWLAIVQVHGMPMYGESIEDDYIHEDSVMQTNLSGDTILEIGTKLNKPFLMLIGKTLNELQMDTRQLLTKFNIVKDHEAVLAQDVCLLHPCSEWSAWSPCDANLREQFGGQNRSRSCGFNTSLCIRFAPPKVEYETQVCQNDYICPVDYTITEHGFCIRVYHSIKEKRDNAEKMCQLDGGHLVNIDSEAKRYDINQTLARYREIDIIWIDGKKIVAGGDWEYHFAPQEPDFYLWAASEPNTPNDLCKVYDRKASGTGLWYWWDRSCLAAYNFVCQIM